MQLWSFNSERYCQLFVYLDAASGVVLHLVATFRPSYLLVSSGLNCNYPKLVYWTVDFFPLTVSFFMTAYAKSVVWRAGKCAGWATGDIQKSTLVVV